MLQTREYTELMPAQRVALLVVLMDMALSTDLMRDHIAFKVGAMCGRGTGGARHAECSVMGLQTERI